MNTKVFVHNLEEYEKTLQTGCLGTRNAKFVNLKDWTDISPDGNGYTTILEEKFYNLDDIESMQIQMLHEFCKEK